MRKRRWICLAVLLSAAPARADCGCGPDFCLQDPRLPGVVAAKKAEMKSDGAPDRLVALFKPTCVAAASRAPDGFNLLIVGKDDSKLTITWTPYDERIARQDLASGKVKRYWIFNALHVLHRTGLRQAARLRRRRRHQHGRCPAVRREASMLSLESRRA